MWYSLLQDTSVFKVVARDPDTGINDVIRYSIEGEIIFTLEYKHKNMEFWLWKYNTTTNDKS